MVLEHDENVSEDLGMRNSRETQGSGRGIVSEIFPDVPDRSRYCSGTS